MNKKIALIVVSALILGGIWWFQDGKKTTDDSTASETIKIGAILPLSGNNADQGEWVKQGLELAQAEINKELKTKIEVVFEDSQADTNKAISAYRNLREKYNIQSVITWGSGIGVALTPIVNKDKVIQFGVATAAANYSTPNDFTFRDFPTSADEARYTANFIINDLKQSRLAILRINNDYGKSVAELFKDEFQKLGGVVSAEDVFTPNGSDFRTQLTKLEKDSSEFVYLVSYPKEGALLLRQSQEMGMVKKYIAAGAIIGGDSFFDTAGSATEGLVVVTSAPNFSDLSNLLIRNFVSAYVEKYEKNPGPQQLYSARAFDALNIIANAQEECESTVSGECLKKSISKVKNYQGVSGDITFDVDGDIVTDFNVQIVNNDQFVKYEE
jgi:branched-chain amino acid transport system substrate-binding protein